MPSFDLRGIKVAKYVNTSGTITYTDAQKLGDAMNVTLELKFAEGRLYAESTLSEYLKLATGGTISIGVKYIPDEVQELIFGAPESVISSLNCLSVMSWRSTNSLSQFLLKFIFFALLSQNCSRNRTSFSKIRRRSPILKWPSARRSRPMPNAQPEYTLESMPQPSSTLG